MDGSKIRGEYAPADAVLAVLRGCVERNSVPRILDRTTILDFGVTGGVSDQVARALRFLGLTDHNGQPTEMFKHLVSGDKSNYKAVLARVVTAAYAPVFGDVDVPVADTGSILSAFEHYDPATQRRRMLRLFMRLCDEAGIRDMQDGMVRLRAVGRPREATTGSRRKGDGQLRSGILGKAENDSNLRLDGIEPSVVEMMRLLPGRTGWKKEEYDLWMSGLSSIVRLTSPIVKVNGKDEAREGGEPDYGDPFADQ